jgi:hypothetical protein
MMALLAYIGWAIIYFFATLVFTSALPHTNKGSFLFLMIVLMVLGVAGFVISGVGAVVSMVLGVGFGIWISD